MEYRIDDLLDEYFDASVSLDTMAYTSADTIKEMTMNKIKGEERGKRRYRKPGVLLVAAAVATLLFGTAMASCVTYFSFREVEEPLDLGYFYITEDDVQQYVDIVDATCAIDLNIPEDVNAQDKVVYYRLNWLPTEYEGEVLPTQPPDMIGIDDEGWIPMFSQVFADLGFIKDGAIVEEFDSSRDLIAYQITVSPVPAPEYDKVLYSIGDVTLVKQDYWNGWGRVEVTVEYENMWQEPVNYLLLYDPEDNVLVTICGMMGLEVFEKIAENMELKVSDELIEYYVPDYDYIGTPATQIDMSRG